MTPAQELQDLIARLQAFQARVQRLSAKDARGLDVGAVNEGCSRALSALRDLTSVIGSP